MKNLLLNSKAIKVFFVCFFLSNFSASAQKTTIWLVRHAEKEAATPKNTDDPSISPDGVKRSVALAKFLRREKVKAIYVTKYKRTAQTAQRLADISRVSPVVYGDTLKQFASSVLKKYKGNSVLVVGHSNTIMPLLAAFGSEVPFDELDEDDYDMIFKVTVSDAGTRTLEISYYGTLHHKSDLPQKYKEDDRPAQPFNRPMTNY